MIKDKIGHHEIILTEDYISWKGNRLNLSEIIDYEYSHAYFNGVGGIDFKIFGSSNVLKFNISPNFRLFHEKFTDDDIDKTESLFFRLLPLLNEVFVNKAVKYIETGQPFKIWKVQFDKNYITMHPRTSFGLKRIEIPYSDAHISFDQHKLGIFGHKGNASFFFLTDERIDKTYLYSRNPNYQPKPSEYMKIKALFDYMQDNYEDEDDTEYEKL